MDLYFAAQPNAGLCNHQDLFHNIACPVLADLRRIIEQQDPPDFGVIATVAEAPSSVQMKYKSG
jgi:hypothetical protein